MTTTTTATEPAGEDYTSSEGLRALLTRLHDAGPGSWEHDPVAAALMGFAAEKYALLARKHRLDAWEAASAAFDVMRSRAARVADDPWAVITHAVRITCIAEERAQGLLCSTHQARRSHVSCFHDAERLSERENALSDYHPAFHTADPEPGGVDDADADSGPADGTTTGVGEAVEDATLLLALLGWPEGTARAAVGHICESLARAGSRAGAYESLRRDRHARALLDVPAYSWTVLLRVLLGNPAPGYAATSGGRGVLLRLLIGEHLAGLLGDDDLVAAVSLAAPGRPAGYRGA